MTNAGDLDVVEGLDANFHGDVSFHAGVSIRRVDFNALLAGEIPDPGGCTAEDRRRRSRAVSAWAHPAAAAEGPREAFRGVIAGIESDLGHRDRFVAQAVRRALKAQSPHQIGDRLTGHGSEHALAVKPRERRFGRHFFNRAGPVETAHDEVDSPVEPAVVLLGGGGTHERTLACRVKLDLTERALLLGPSWRTARPRPTDRARRRQRPRVVIERDVYRTGWGTRVSTTSSRPSSWSAAPIRLAAVRCRGSSMRRTTFTSTPRRRARPLRERPLSRSASTNAAFAAVSAGTATSCSAASRTLGTGIGSPSAGGCTMRPAMATSKASAASARASASSAPEVGHSGKSRNETTTSSGPVRCNRAG